MNYKKLFAAVLAIALFFTAGLQGISAGTISQGVYHTSESKIVDGKHQRINQLSVNMNKPYTTIDVGISNPFTTLATTSTISRSHSTHNHHVIGAINASLFTFQNGLPSYLLADGEEIVNLGAVSTKSNDFMHVPAAFGVTPDNKAKIGTYELSYTIEHNGKQSMLTSLNRERVPGESILFTSSWPYETTRTNPVGMEVVVTTPSSVNTGNDFGEKLTGTVTDIRPYGEDQASFIPENGFVISASGSVEVDKVRNMKIGDTVGLTIDVEDQWKGSKFMLATGPLLVQKGAVDLTIDLDSTRTRERTARTAVATNADGSSAYFVTVDSGIIGSSGMTLVEFASYLKSIGAYNAINLDGGGSTTMVARKYGDRLPSLVNRPSQGSERRVSAILEAISTAPYGVGTYVKASPERAGSIPVDAIRGFKVDSVLDQYYNPLPIDQSKLTLESVSTNVGKIVDNQFVAEEIGTGTITATYDNASISLPVTVVSNKPVAMSTLDTNNGLSFEGIRSNGSLSTEKTIQPKQGYGSVKLSYDFTPYKEGISAAYMKWNSPYKIPHHPTRVGAWIYGDGMNHWLRGSLTDATGKEFVVDFTAEDQLDWVGWKYVEAEIPATVTAPLSLNKIYVAETKSTRKTDGSIWVDGLQAIYTEGPTEELSFVPDPDARVEESDKDFTITFSQDMNSTFLHGKYIYVEDQYGVRQAVTVKQGASPKQVVVEAPIADYETGKNYRLVVTHMVPNKSDINMVKDHITEFTVR